MTPEAANILSSLRESFYDLFQTEMKVPVKLSKGKSLIFNPSMAPVTSWVDRHNRVNCLAIYAHAAPDSLIPQRPLILRIAVNQWPNTANQASKNVKDPQFNRDWSWELSLLSEQMMDFAPWLASWIEAESRSTELMQRSPHALKFFPHPIAQNANLAWTQEALAMMVADDSVAA
ncbi:hypothetical protein C1752_04007 [Acaryochloris thomasi RCC1774]|uniref:Uncharacterized protein n=1 Tax=Acaryochloris thomasi RCC1774 TaxID=1764569 RepID=A0A2W1JF70_9CYAN|nr:hypothetical protein [Acaryochloris thomasi]PZD72116.1 hypothetical protein C1752_04007 [Acaryochloris thomasi RCC1774]